jgi:hypothetical protein
VNDLDLIQANQIAIMRALGLVVVSLDPTNGNAESQLLKNHANRTQDHLDMKLNQSPNPTGGLSSFGGMQGAD